MFRTLIVYPLGWILNFIYQFVQNYGWSLIVFTLAVKILLLPLNLKQQKSTTRMQMVQPKMAELQKKYENDKNKLSEETMKLYKDYEISPMGGCLPMLIQLPILFGLYRVIYQPLTYMLRMGEDVVNGYMTELGLTKTPQVEIFIAKAKDLVNFNFLGLDLSATPSFTKIDWLWLIPILAAGTTFLTSKITTWVSGQGKKKEEEPQKPTRVLNPEAKPASPSGESTMKTMTYFMPIMTGWIAFSFPAALGLYWTISNVVSLAQTLLLNGYYSKKLKEEFILLEERKALEESEKRHKRKKG
ncbi:MAG: YidC/Oxa1 family membrane protein insertase [Ruminococcaceae bacterium]|nr:YidC/Oxa1 family membrane protein insertase [Oscillospiraceae bacterium]